MDDFEHLDAEAGLSPVPSLRVVAVRGRDVSIACFSWKRLLGGIVREVSKGTSWRIGNSYR